MTAIEQDDDEQSLLHYLDLKYVVETAVAAAVESRTIEIAKKLIKRNLSNIEIAEDTGLTVE